MPECLPISWEETKQAPLFGQPLQYQVYHIAETSMFAIPNKHSEIDKTLYTLIRKCKLMRESIHKVAGGGVGRHSLYSFCACCTHTENSLLNR